MMNADRITQDAPGWRVRCLEETTSTSDVARDAGLRGEDGGLAIFAEAQTAGRGQRSNRWVTPAGKDLMFSVLLRPQVSLELWPRLTTLAALAVCEAVEAMLPLRPQIKWPNDVYLNGRKVSGLLAETAPGPQGFFLVLGIGLNVNATAFPPELEGQATSLLRELPVRTLPEIDREPLAALLLNRLSAVMAWWAEDFHLAVEAVRERSLLIGKSIRAQVDGTPLHGRVRDLNHEGHLILELLDGSARTLSSAAEVRW